jgi:hypothetical protein
MSKKHSKPESVPLVESGPPPGFMEMVHEHQLNQAIEKVTQWFAKCPGPCFPHVYRGWDS